MVVGKPKKDTRMGSLLKFVNSGGGNEWITQGTENPKTVINRMSLIKTESGGVHVKGFGGKNVKEIGSMG
jgi:hypothetical protein